MTHTFAFHCSLLSPSYINIIKNKVSLSLLFMKYKLFLPVLDILARLTIFCSTSQAFHIQTFCWLTLKFSVVVVPNFRFRFSGLFRPGSRFGVESKSLQVLLHLDNASLPLYGPWRVIKTDSLRFNYVRSMAMLTWSFVLHES